MGFYTTEWQEFYPLNAGNHSGRPQNNIFSGHQQHYAIQFLSTMSTFPWIGFKTGQFTGKPIVFLKFNGKNPMVSHGFQLFFCPDKKTKNHPRLRHLGGCGMGLETSCCWGWKNPWIPWGFSEHPWHFMVISWWFLMDKSLIIVDTEWDIYWDARIHPAAIKCGVLEHPPFIDYIDLVRWFSQLPFGKLT